MERIVIIGIGASGLDVLGRIQPRSSPAPLLIGVDTDQAALDASGARIRILVPPAADEAASARVRIEPLLLPHIADADTVILAAALGDVAAASLLSVVARLVREHDIAVFILATTPTASEDRARHELARRTLEETTGVTVLLAAFPADSDATAATPDPPAALGPIFWPNMLESFGLHQKPHETISRK